MSQFNALIYQDTRFWEVFDENKNSLGLFMYGDLIIQFAHGQGVLGTALENLKSKNYSWKVVGDITPLGEDSAIPEIQSKKIEYRIRERKKEKKRAKKKGFKLDSAITFGKHSGTSIRKIIDNHPSYWSWMMDNDVILLHPEVKIYCEEKSK